MDESKGGPNLKQAVPFFMVTDIDRSLEFYTKGLSFEIKDRLEAGRENRMVLAGKRRCCNHATGISGRI